MNHIINSKSIRVSFNCCFKACSILISVLLLSCTSNVPDGNVINAEPKISPDYSGITLPPNIAPLNFTIDEQADKYSVKLDSRRGFSIIMDSNDGQVIIPMKKWKNLLKLCKGNDLFIDVSAKKGDKWVKFKTITNHVS